MLAIYRTVASARAGEARQLVSSMGVLYTATMLVILVVALRFVNPTQLVARVKESRDDWANAIGRADAGVPARPTVQCRGATMSTHGAPSGAGEGWVHAPSRPHEATPRQNPSSVCSDFPDSLPR